LYAGARIAGHIYRNLRRYGPQLEQLGHDTIEGVRGMKRLYSHAFNSTAGPSKRSRIRRMVRRSMGGRRRGYRRGRFGGRRRIVSAKAIVPATRVVRHTYYYAQKEEWTGTAGEVLYATSGSNLIVAANRVIHPNDNHTAIDQPPQVSEDASAFNYMSKLYNGCEVIGSRCTFTVRQNSNTRLAVPIVVGVRCVEDSSPISTSYEDLNVLKGCKYGTLYTNADGNASKTISVNFSARKQFQGADSKANTAHSPLYIPEDAMWFVPFAAFLDNTSSNFGNLHMTIKVSYICRWFDPIPVTESSFGIEQS